MIEGPLKTLPLNTLHLPAENEKIVRHKHENI